MSRDNAENRYYWKQDRWDGGEAEDSRIGPKGSGRYLLGLDIFADSGLLKVARKPTALTTGITWAAVIKWMEVRASNGDVYHYSGDKIVKESSGSYTTPISSLSDSAAGQGLREFNSVLYYRTSTQLGKYDYTTNTANYQTGLTACSDFAPMEVFRNFLCGANGRYVFTLDDLGTFTAQRIKLPPGYKVRDLFVAGPYLVILAIKGSLVTDSEDGMAFLWDGVAQTYVDYFPIDGNPHAGIAVRNTITLIAGDQPTIQESLGGVPEVMFAIPNVGDGKTAEVWPGAIERWKGRAYFGISDGTSTTVVRVIRGWGAKNSNHAKISNPEYPASTGTLTGTGMQITAIKKVGQTIRFAWKDGSSYGIDTVDNTAFQSSGKFRTLAYDRESPHVKVGVKLMVEFAGALAANESVTAKVSPDPYGDPTFAGSDVVSKTESTTGAKLLELPLGATTEIRSRDLQIEISPGGSASTKPSVKRMWFDNIEEADQL